MRPSPAGGHLWPLRSIEPPRGVLHWSPALVAGARWTGLFVVWQPAPGTPLSPEYNPAMERWLMRRLCLAAPVVLAMVVGLGLAGLGQGEANLSLGRGFGIGVRWLPAALAPVSGSSGLPQALDPVVTLQYWLNDQMGGEFGGWVSSLETPWGSQSAVILMGGLLLRLSDNALADGYLAGRAIRMYSQYTAVAGAQDGMAEGNSVSPWPGYESRNSGLGVELAGGVEWSWSPLVSTSFEVGFAYIQVITTQIAPPSPEPPDDEPVPRQGVQTFAATGLGITLRVGISFHLPRK